MQCDFADLPTSSQGTASNVPPKINEHLSRASARERINSYLEKVGIPCVQLKNPTEPPCANLELLDHFTKEAGPWIGSPECQRMMQQHGLQLSVEAPYLMHAILAFSASHLNFLHPTERKYRIAATLHYDLSLALYSAQIRNGIDACNADAILGCCFLHTMLAFQNVQSAEQVESGNELTWLRTMQGTAILRSNIHPHLDDTSIWHRVAIESRGEEEFFCNHIESEISWASTTSKALHRLCEMELESSVQENPYEKPLSRLCLLMQCDIGQDKIGMFMSFIGRLPPNFVQLLDGNDPRATLILCYWCALLSQIEQWWIVRSATVECARFCAYLDTIPDEMVHDLLRFPASKCGYLIRDCV